MDISVILLAVCGISALCLVGIGVVAFFLLRTTGVDVFAPVRDLLSSSDDEEQEYIKPKRKNGTSRASLREKRSGYDGFDAAVQRHQQDSGEKAKSDSPFPEPDRLGSANRFDDGKRFSNKLDSRRSRRRNDDTYSLYDDDEDAFVEF